MSSTGKLSLGTGESNKAFVPVDEFTTTLPQEVVAGLGMMQRIDGKVMLACRPPKPDTQSKIMSLEPLEYRVLSLAAKGWTRERIATGTESSVTKSQEYLGSACTKLGVRDTEEAVTFLPMRYDFLRSWQFSRLKKRPEEVLRAIGRGLTAHEISQALEISPKTVHSHRSTIITRLDIPGNPDQAAVHLRRLAGAYNTFRVIESRVQNLGK